MFSAALGSRSWTVPQSLQAHSLILRPAPPCRPHLSNCWQQNSRRTNKTECCSFRCLTRRPYRPEGSCIPASTWAWPSPGQRALGHLGHGQPGAGHVAHKMAALFFTKALQKWCSASLRGFLILALDGSGALSLLCPLHNAQRLFQEMVGTRPARPHRAASIHLSSLNVPARSAYLHGPRLFHKLNFWPTKWICPALYLTGPRLNASLPSEYLAELGLGTRQFRRVFLNCLRRMAYSTHTSRGCE